MILLLEKINIILRNDITKEEIISIFEQLIFGITGNIESLDVKNPSRLYNFIK